MPFGKKECPSCKASVGIRSLTCKCGFKWGEKKSPEKKPTSIFDEPGKGRKQCAKCQKHVGCRVVSCPNCGGTEFLKKAPPIAQSGQTYDKGGQGRKQCANCSRYFGAKRQQCPNCGSEKSIKVIKPLALRETFDGPGKGRKQCSCGKYSGLRSKICPACNREFKFKEQMLQATREPTAEPVPVGELPKPIEIKPSERPLGGGGRRCVSTPSGKCPVKLNSNTREDVELWAHSLMDYAQKQDVSYTVSALKYWVRDTYEVSTDDHKLCCEHLESIFLG